MHSSCGWMNRKKRLNLSDYEVAKKGGFSHSVLSRARSGISPKWDVCISGSKVFNVFPITVFRKAGLLTEGPEDKTKFEDWEYLLSQLSPEDQEELRQIAELKLNKRQKDNSLKSLKTKKAG
jgi:hypothetical protein